MAIPNRDEPNLWRTIDNIKGAATSLRRTLQSEPAAGKPVFDPTSQQLYNNGALNMTPAQADRFNRPTPTGALPDRISRFGFDGTPARPTTAATTDVANRSTAPGASPSTGTAPPSAPTLVDRMRQLPAAASRLVGALTPSTQSDPGKLYRTGANGEHIYSDGTGGIPATMTRQQAQSGNLPGNVTVVPSAAFSRPLLSDVTGHANSSTADGVAMRMAALQRQQPVTGSRPSPEAFAEANRLSALNRDPRSAYGIAARDAQVRSGGDTSRTGRRIAAGQLADLMSGPQTAAAGLAGRMTSQQEQDAALQRVIAQGQVEGQNALDLAQQEALARPRQPITLEDGTLASFNENTGAVAPAAMPDGTPARVGRPTDDAARKRTQQIMDQLNKSAMENLKLIVPLGDQPTDADYSEARRRAALSMGAQRFGKDEAGRTVARINGEDVLL